MCSENCKKTAKRKQNLFDRNARNIVDNFNAMRRLDTGIHKYVHYYVLVRYDVSLCVQICLSLCVHIKRHIYYMPYSFRNLASHFQSSSSSLSLSLTHLFSIERRRKNGFVLSFRLFVWLVYLVFFIFDILARFVLLCFDLFWFLLLFLHPYLFHEFSLNPFFNSQL